MTGKASTARLAIAAACLLLAGAAFGGDSLAEEAKGAEWMKSLLKVKPELAAGAPEVAAGDNALGDLLTWMEKDYPEVKDDMPAPILSGIEVWKMESLAELRNKHREQLDGLVALTLMWRDSSALSLPRERIAKLRREDLLQIRSMLTCQAFALFRGGEQQQSLIPIQSLLGLSRIIGDNEALSRESLIMSLEAKASAVTCIHVLLDKEKVPFQEDTLRAMEQMMQTPRWPEPMADALRRYWTYHTYRLVLPSCRGNWLDLAVPEYVLNHPKAGTTALASCAAAWLAETGKLSLADYSQPLPAPAWDAPDGLPEEARLWVPEQYQPVVEMGKEIASTYAWMHLIRAALLDALGTPDADDGGVKISFKTVDGRRVACLPDDFACPYHSVPVPEMAR